MEKDHKAVDVAKRGDAIAMKIEVRLLLCTTMVSRRTLVHLV